MKDKSNASLKAAQAILELDFDKKLRDRMHELAVKGQEGTLAKHEEQELDNYRRVGYLFDLMRSKARIIVKKHAG